MVKIFSPSSNGVNLGQSLADLGRQMFGDTGGAEKKRQETYALQRENTETDNLMGRVAQSGAQTLGSDPVAQGMIIGSGYDPADFAKIGLMGAATGFGAKDQRTQNWQVGSGQSYDNTSGAFDAKLAETARSNNMQSSDRRYGVDKSIGQAMYEFMNAPKAALGEDGQTTFAPQGDLTKGGYQPIVSETDQKGILLGQNFANLPALDPMQRQVLGANPSESGRTPRNYRAPDGTVHITYDGVSDAATGGPLPGGGYIAGVEGGAEDTGLTNSTRSGVQQNIIANNKFKSLSEMTRQAAMADPNNFGLPGFVKGTAQDLRVIGEGMAVGLGFTGIQQALDETSQKILANPDVDPNLLMGVFDPSRDELLTLSDLMVYSAAEALAGQSGRSVSDKDVQFFKGIVGNPRDFFMNQPKYLAKLTQIERILDRNQQTLGSALNGAPAPAAPAPAAPTAPISIDGVSIRKIGD